MHTTEKVSVTELHTDEQPAAFVQLSAPILRTEKGGVVVGRITDSRPNPHKVLPSLSGKVQCRDEAVEARRYLVASFQQTMQHLTSMPATTAAQEAAALIRGTSGTGYMATYKERRRLSTIEDLRAMVFASHEMLDTRLFDQGSKRLFSFAVPRGWVAYAGEATLGHVADFYHKRDLACKASWEAWNLKCVEASAVEGVPPPSPGRPYMEEKDPITGSSWGPWMQLFLGGCRTGLVQTPVVAHDGAVHMQWKALNINTNIPMHRTESVSYVIDRLTNRLVCWHPGWYMPEMTPMQSAQQLILVSGDVSDEQS